MPLPTSDFHRPVCLEMKNFKNEMSINALIAGATTTGGNSSTDDYGYGSHGGGGGGGDIIGHSSKSSVPGSEQNISYTHSTITLPIESSVRQSSLISNSNNNNNNNNTNTSNNNNSNNLINNNNNNNTNGDLASIDSSDTYASCQTHPFLSQGDLTADDIADMACTIDDIDLNNLYINPLEKEVTNIKSATKLRSQVKKSTSGDTALRSLGASPMDDGFQKFQSFDITADRGSRVSLNESPVPKHRKTRFQQQQQQHYLHHQPQQQPQPSSTLSQQTQQHKIRSTRFEGNKNSLDSINGSGIVGGDTCVSSNSGGGIVTGGGSSSISGGSITKKNRRASFMPAKSLASATKLINQHLFGIQSSGNASKSKTSDSGKLSLSSDSIDVTTNIDTHRRSKSILKNKSDASSKIPLDPESERLLSDNLSGAGISETGSGDVSSDYSPNKMPHTYTAKSSISPILNQRHRTLVQQRSVPVTATSISPSIASSSTASHKTKYQNPRYPEELLSRQIIRTPLQRSTGINPYIDHLTGEMFTRDSSLESETHSTSGVTIGCKQDSYISTDEKKSLITRGNSNESAGETAGDSFS